MSYASQDRDNLIRVSNETRFNGVSKVEMIRENSLYQKYKTDEELKQMEEDIKIREKKRLKKRGLI